MIFWENIQGAFFEKEVTELKNDETASITHGGKYCEEWMVVVCVFGKGKIYPHTVRNFKTVGECKAFVDEYEAANAELTGRDAQDQSSKSAASERSG